jgi:hypothetical protein
MFTAGAVAGMDTIYVNASMNGLTRTSSVVPITVTSIPPPMLEEVSIAPGNATLPAGSTQAFTAQITCGVKCPSGAIYSWSLSNWLGVLDTYSGPSVNFTAGSLSGNISLFVNVSLNGVVKGASVPIQVHAPPPPPQPILVSLTLNPTNATMHSGQSQTFSAMATCSGAPCPANLTYLWRLSANAGTITSGTSNQTTFTAGSQSTTVLLTVTVVLGTKVLNASAGITILPSQKPVNSGSGDLTLYILLGIGAAGAAVLALAAISLRRRRRAAETAGLSATPEQDVWERHFEYQPPMPPPR